jgi:hypothetical protein
VAQRLIVFASLNQVAILKRALYHEGVYVEMLRTPQNLSSTGCSFAVRCQAENVPLLLQVCAKWSIKPGGVFEETEETLRTRPRQFSEDELEQ